jgi:outer membrane protein TolC
MTSDRLSSAAFAVLALALADAGAARAEERLSLVEAVRLTVARQPEIKLSERDVERSEGEQQIARGDFDPTVQLSLLRARNRTPLLADGGAGLAEEQTNESGYQVGVAKLFRSGLVVSPRIEMSRTRSCSSGW